MKTTNKKAAWILVLSGCLLLSGCLSPGMPAGFLTASQQTLQTSYQPQPAGNAASSYLQLSPVYSTDYGELELQQNGNYVAGTYPTGTIEGTISGRVLTGRWVQAYSQGGFIFEFSPDGGSFRGLWGMGDAEMTGAWNGTRSSAEYFAASADSGASYESVSTAPSASSAPSATYADPYGGSAQAAPVPVQTEQPQYIAGTYKSTYGDLVIYQTGDYAAGYYPGGTIEGTISGGVLTGRWDESSSYGGIRFEFSPDGSSFTGLWGREDGELDASWDGSRYL